MGANDRTTEERCWRKKDAGDTYNPVKFSAVVGDGLATQLYEFRVLYKQDFWSIGIKYLQNMFLVYFGIFWKSSSIACNSWSKSFTRNSIWKVSGLETPNGYQF